VLIFHDAPFTVDIVDIFTCINFALTAISLQSSGTGCLALESLNGVHAEVTDVNPSQKCLYILKAQIGEHSQSRVKYALSRV